MEEKTIIEGKPSKKTSTMLLWIGLLLLIVGLILFIYKTGFVHDLDNYSLQLLKIYGEILGLCFVFIYPVINLILVSVILDLGILFFLVGLILWLSIKHNRITVTNKRVYGTTKWGKRVDLPLNQISAVSTSWLKGIAIGTSSGKIIFKGIEKNTDVHKELSALLAAKQDESVPKTHMVQNNNFEDLKKLKELLDSGIITQEEFDAKKKQLLGL